MLRKLLAEDTGATSIEYAVIASLISIAAIGAMLLVGAQNKQNFETVETAYANSR